MENKKLYNLNEILQLLSQNLVASIVRNFFFFFLSWHLHATVILLTWYSLRNCPSSNLGAGSLADNAVTMVSENVTRTESY